MIYLRRNHVQESIGEFYDVSQSTISRVIGPLIPVVRPQPSTVRPTSKHSTLWWRRWSALQRDRWHPWAAEHGEPYCFER